MRITERRLNRATLARQLLLRREPLGVPEAVRRVVALQAQEAASPYLALWNRLDGFDPAELDAAFARHEIVKATLMRITLHAVHAEDYPAFQNAMRRSLRAARLGDRRYTGTGLTIADADAAVPYLAEILAEPRTRPQIEAALTALGERIGTEQARWMWWALRTFGPLVHAPTGGPWSFGPRASYVVPRTPPALEDVDGSLPHLVRRYLEGFGPAGPADIARFTLLTRAKAKAGLRALGEEVETLQGPDGAPLWDVPGAPLPAEDTPAPPRLLGMWDSVLLAYADRARMVPPDLRTVITRVNGDVLPTLLVDGRVAGVWRPVEGGIEATALRPLTAADWDGLAAEAAALAGFLAGRDPEVYRRYGHWWAKLPPGEVRVLPGPAS